MNSSKSTCPSPDTIKKEEEDLEDDEMIFTLLSCCGATKSILNIQNGDAKTNQSIIYFYYLMNVYFVEVK